uniref:SET domain-containing protein n=1 Tax=Tetradesmus obliquus TaxID=3088 RepID=A0A383VDZ6_TETOB|eukprot:jgi/Sobl393_1/13480/SZX63183.1
MLTSRFKSRASGFLASPASQCDISRLRCSIRASSSAAGSAANSAPGSAQSQGSRNAKSVSSSSTALSIVPWAISNGIQFAKIKPAVFGSTQERGVVATFDIGRNECICSVPAKAALRTYPGCSPALGVAADMWQQLPWYAQLALVLLSELQQGKSSKFADYSALLPEQVDVPALWSEEELQQLRCPYFIEQVQQQRQQWAGLAQQLQPALSAARITQQQLLWALSVTRSRAFAAPYAAAPLSLAPKALAAAQVVAAAAWLAAGPAAAAGVELLGVAAAAGAWFTLQQQLQSQQQQHAICPLLDFFNHDGREQSECELDVWSNAFRVVSTQQWRQGQQVFISYGQSSSDVLLRLYGFVEQGNVHERYLVRSLPDVLVKQELASAAAAANSVELAEVAFTRQGIPAAAAAALERACRQQQPSASSTLEGITPFAALSSAARSACAEAVRLELQLLGADQQTLAHDQSVLQAVQQLPAKQQELEAGQARLQERQAELQQLQEQLEQWQQQQQQQQEEAEAGAAEGSEDGEGRHAAEGEEQQAAWIEVVAAAAAEVEGMQQQVAALQQQVADWQQLLAGQKLLAVQFRLEKQQLLEGLLAQLG